MNFKEYSKYYNLLYKDKNTHTECSYVIKKLEQYHESSIKKVLELGAGSGRHGAIFKKMGIDWAGIERSVEMIQLAAEKKVTIIQGDIIDVNLNEKYPAIASLFHVVSYLTSNRQLNQLFQNVHRHLDNNGIFLFDVWYTPAVYFQKPEKRRKEVEDEDLRIVRHACPIVDWNKSVVNVIYKIKIFNKRNGETTKIQENHPMRHFTIPEIENIAGFHNFEFIEAEEWLTGKAPSTDTWGVTMIMRKYGK